MINPFRSADDMLSEIGWNKYVDNHTGFVFIKKIGIEVFHKAIFVKSKGIKFYDELVVGHDYDSVYVNEKELALFSKKIKEWRYKYERAK